MTNLTITAKYLPILARFAAKKDIRYFLNGFLAEPHPWGGATLVATDGHSMCIIYDKEAVCEEIQIRPIPKRMVALAKKHDSIPVVYVGNDVSTAGEQLNGAGESIDGTYPDWRKVVPFLPVKCDGLAVDTPQLDKFSGMGGIRIFASGDGGSSYIVRSEECPEFLAVVMGYRYDVPPSDAIQLWAIAAGIPSATNSE